MFFRMSVELKNESTNSIKNPDQLFQYYITTLNKMTNNQNIEKLKKEKVLNNKTLINAINLRLKIHYKMSG